MEPRVFETSAARALLAVAIALLSALAVRAPTSPGALALVHDGSACRLGAIGSSSPCSCEDLPADARSALGLALALNSADPSDLERVPGIGPNRALAITTERARAGEFESLEALSRRVRGIGPKTIDRIRPHLFAVGPDPACGEGSPS